MAGDESSGEQHVEMQVELAGWLLPLLNFERPSLDVDVEPKPSSMSVTRNDQVGENAASSRERAYA